MTNTLGLDDDLDGVMLLKEIEESFDLRVPDKDAERMERVGDFYDWLVDNVDPHCDGKKCASAMTFYRLRGAIRRLGFDIEPTPATKLDFLEGRKLKANLSNLAKETGL